MKPYVAGSIPDAVLQQIINETIGFDFPLVQVNSDIFPWNSFMGLHSLLKTWAPGS